MPASYSQTFTLTATSPASATTTAQTAVKGFSNYTSLTLYTVLQGATGGVLDVYLQTSFDGGTTWTDYWHSAQLSAGAAAAAKVWGAQRGASVTTGVAVNTANGTPVLAVNTLLNGPWGDQFRVIMVAGASTSAGASQTIVLYGNT